MKSENDIKVTINWHSRLGETFKWVWFDLLPVFYEIETEFRKHSQKNHTKLIEIITNLKDDLILSTTYVIILWIKNEVWFVIRHKNKQNDTTRTSLRNHQGPLAWLVRVIGVNPGRTWDTSSSLARSEVGDKRDFSNKISQQSGLSM